MLKKYSHLFEGLFMATDLLVASLSWVISYWLRFSSGMIPVDKGVPEFADYLRLVIFVWLIWTFVYRRFGLYRPMRASSIFRESWQVAKANALSVVLLLAVTYLFREKSVEFSRLVFVIFFALSTFMAVGSRSLVRALLRKMRRQGHNLRYALIVGAGDLAQNVAERMRTHPEYGIDLLGCLASEEETASRGYRSLRLFANGRRYPIMTHNNLSYSYGNFQGTGSGSFLEKNPVKGFAAANPAFSSATLPVSSHGFRSGASLQVQPSEWPEQKFMADQQESLVPVIGSYADLPYILAEGGIDQVIVALPLCDHSKIEAVVSSIGDLMVDVKIVPDLHRFIQLGSQVEELDGLPVVSLASTPLMGINKVVKRVFDLSLSLVFVMLTLPLMVIIALLVKLTSKGPVLFRQDRMGLDGRVFHIYKFRTMYVDAESQGAKFAVRGDPRVTLLGRFLRRFSLDELPQFFNVIVGQMSLVGPRPERPVFINEFRKRIPRYMLRHKVQAGLTGWAQVNGWRGNTSIEKRIEHDLHYIENWSVFFDLKILLLTIYTALTDRNAY